MKPKKSASLLLADVVAASALSGCEQNAAQNNDGKPHVFRCRRRKRESPPKKENMRSC